MTMSTPTEDRQFLFMSLVAAWTLLRIAATVLGVVPWSGWIIVAVFAVVSAFVAFGNPEEA